MQEVLTAPAVGLTRQQNRRQERMQAKLDAKIRAAMKTNPMMQAAYNMGWNEGSEQASRFTIKDCYAAALLAMEEIGHYKHNGCMRLMRTMDDIVVNRLYTEELIDEVFERLGIRINFREPFDRIEEVVK